MCCAIVLYVCVWMLSSSWDTFYVYATVMFFLAKYAIVMYSSIYHMFLFCGMYVCCCVKI
jgi:hypothetical protein